MIIMSALATATGLLLTSLPAAADPSRPTRVALIDARGACPEAVGQITSKARAFRELSRNVMDKGSMYPLPAAYFQEYLDFHVQAQQDTAGRVTLMPWSELRTHAN